MNTIAAISTPHGSGGIAVIRISGDEAFCITDRFFICHKAKRLFELNSNTVVYGKVYDKDNKLIDDVLVSVFKAPNSYTGENIVEISCHGGILIQKKVLKAALDNGAVMAQRGEFTKRAFLNGKMDLSQAEGVIDLINSVSDKGAETAVFQMEGRLSQSINAVRERLIGLLTHLEAIVDFPEEGVEVLEENEMLSELEYCYKKTDELIKSSDYGKIIKEGMPVAVIGKPNVGKSSLLNCISGCNKAIVTDIAGTTRDIVEEYVNINGTALKIMDTAGIRETNDKVESIGVSRSIDAAEKASLILAVFDNSKAFDQEDKKILDFIQDKPHIVVLNKCDVESKNTMDGVKISAKTSDGITELFNEISGYVESCNISSSEDIITSERHYECLIKSKENLERAINAQKSGIPLDLVTMDISQAVEAYGEIVGLTVSEEIVDKIFSTFCVGK